MAIGFTSCERLDVPVDRTAKLEIMSWDDPVMAGTPRGQDGHFVIDGLVPIEVAIELNALCVRSGACVDILGLDELDHADLEAETGRVLIEGLVPLAIAEQAQAICNAHNTGI